MFEEKMVVLGTGNGAVVDCYNTCFLIQNNNEYLMVDAGGGNGVIAQLKKSNIDIEKIHDIIISHNHMDHLIGLFWVMRTVAKSMHVGKYIGNFNIYCSKAVKELIVSFLDVVFPKLFVKYYKERMIFNIIEDKKEVNISGYKIKFLDLFSKEGEQFGFKIKLKSEKELVFLGDVPCDERLYNELQNVDWMLHEAFCMYNEKDKYKPYEKGHGTVKEVSVLAGELNVKNLVLWHAQDNDLKNRKNDYSSESKQYYNGNVYVPDDLDVILL